MHTACQTQRCRLGEHLCCVCFRLRIVLAGVQHSALDWTSFGSAIDALICKHR